MKKYVVITGASSGIGYSTAKAFAKRNKNLILIARREANLLQLKEEILQQHTGIDIVIKAFDLTKTEQIPQLFKDLDIYDIETWINNAGFGLYSMIENQNIEKTYELLKLNIEALTIASILFVQKYHSTKGTQLINISSAGGYTMVPTAVTYCASKFYVSSFTEGLALELKANHSELKAKVLAPAATKTEFGKVANDVDEYDYNKAFGTYHTSEEMAQFLMQLYDSEYIVGYISRDDFSFKLSQNKFNSSMDSNNNQKIE